MTEPKRILFLEDDSADAELVSRTLRREGLECELARVQTEQEFLEALDRGGFELILADYSLPGFDGLTALRWVRERGLELPFVFVSGSLGEEKAVEILKAGATDYVVKGRLDRLVPCLRRALQEAAERVRLRQTEEALRQSEERLRLAIESAQMSTWSLDVASGSIHWSLGDQVLCPPPPSEPTRAVEDFLQRIHPEDRAQVRGALDRTLREGAEYQVEFRVVLPAGKIHWRAAFGRLYRDAEGRPSRILGVGMDITRRREAEERVRKLAAFPQLNPNPVLEFAGDGSLTYFNEAAVSVARSIGRGHPSEILPPNTSRVVRQCLDTGESRLRLETVHGRRTLSWSFFPILQLGVVHCYMGDVTERLQLEEQFRQAQKMESVGQLAGGVAHDFNNLLQVIQGYALLAKDESMAPPERHAHLDEVLAASDRAAQLTRQLLAFGRRQPLQKADIDLNEVVGQLLKMIRRLIGEHIEVEFTPGPDLFNVCCDRAQLEQVLVNLCVNARDALPKGGRIDIRSENRVLRAEDLDRHPGVPPGRYVALRVSDNGSGMDKETLERIFEPFFTTKPMEQGTGLGLAVIYGVVRQHDGLIDVQSEPGQGTVFTIFLPAREPASSPAKTTLAQRPPGSKASETILLAEDEEVVRQLAARVLQGAGYRVLSAADGEEAVRLFAECASGVDLALLDVVMPRLGGREAYERIARIRPTLPVLFCSGYSGPAAQSGVPLDPRRNLLHKPYTPDELLRRIRNLLDERSGVAPVPAAAGALHGIQANAGTN